MWVPKLELRHVCLLEHAPRGPLSESRAGKFCLYWSFWGHCSPKTPFSKHWTSTEEHYNSSGPWVCALPNLSPTCLLHVPSMHVSLPHLFYRLHAGRLSISSGPIPWSLGGFQFMPSGCLFIKMFDFFPLHIFIPWNYPLSTSHP